MQIGVNTAFAARNQVSLSELGLEAADDDDVQQRKRVTPLPCLKRRWRGEGLAGTVHRGQNKKSDEDPECNGTACPDDLSCHAGSPLWVP